MKRSVIIAREPIDESDLLRHRQMSAAMGAAVYFSGVVRRMEGEKDIRGIDYESFDRMAVHQFELILQEVEKRWPVESVRLVHRVGPVQVNEVSIWLEVIAPHRGEAFAAGQFIIDEMKQKVPIWKHPF